MFRPGNNVEPAPDKDGGMLGTTLLILVCMLAIAAAVVGVICGR